MNTIAPTSAHPSEYPQSLILPGVRLQEALRHGQDVQTHFDTYCRRAFRRAETAKQGAYFILNTFEGRMPDLVGLISIHHLVCEMNAGSHFLTSSVAAHWDKTGNFAKLAELAESVALGWSEPLLKPSVLEFLLALASAVAITYPERTKAVLDLAESGCTSPELHMAWADAREWQQAGELLKGAEPAQKIYWHQQLVKPGGSEIWNTSEARQAVALLERLNPNITSMRTLYAQVVPPQLWSRPLTVNALAKNTTPEPAKPMAPPPRAEAKPVNETKVTQPQAPQSTPMSAPTTKRRWFAPWRVVGLAGITAAAAWMLKPSRPVEDGGQKGSSPSEAAIAPMKSATAASTSSSAGAPKIVTPTSVVADTGSSPAETHSPVEPAKLQADAPPSPPQNTESRGENEVAAVKAQPLPVQAAERSGWVRTPLGEELPLAANAVSNGTITDAAGRVWALPDKLDAPQPAKQADQPEAAPSLASDAPPASPAAAKEPATPAAESNSAPPQPPPLEVQKAEAASPSAATAAAASDTVPPPAAVAPREELTKDEPAPIAQTKRPASKVTSKTVSSASTSSRKNTAHRTKAVSSPPTATSDSDSSGRMAAVGLHPDYFKDDAPSGTTAVLTTPQTFITRANSIRMSYKGGYWESKPRAYLEGAGISSDAWARDMTLRERSSGTIPKGFVFDVTSTGTVRLVPGLDAH